jgi:hypothetical protein
MLSQVNGQSLCPREEVMSNRGWFPVAIQRRTARETKVTEGDHSNKIVLPSSLHRPSVSKQYLFRVTNLGDKRVTLVWGSPGDTALPTHLPSLYINPAEEGEMPVPVDLGPWNTNAQLEWFLVLADDEEDEQDPVICQVEIFWAEVAS